MNLAPLSDESESNTPAIYAGWLATIPTTFSFNQAKSITKLRAYFSWT